VFRRTKDGEDVSVRFTTASTDKELEDGLKECTFTLKIPAGRHEDTGEYKVTASNKWGSADSSVSVVMRSYFLLLTWLSCPWA
jgi:hypothetical protein